MEISYTKVIPEITIPEKEEIKKVNLIIVDLEAETYTIGVPPALGVMPMTEDDITYWTNYLTGKLSADETIKNTNITARGAL